ncbi:MAG: geranylgeranylglycerol-phosphate geranylgeranyltransferase [Cyclobacteriaceae bacterium]|nr:geranylgeranylglycerol-phosphate geranylgeranyltransferase [Cyclobacteriaceae bacterium]
MATENLSATRPVTFSFKGILKLVRWPNLLIIALSQYLAAIYLVGPPEDWKHYVLDYKLFLITVGTVLIAAAGYIINDYYDVKIDYINKPQKVVVGSVLKRRAAMFIHSGLNVLGVIVGLFVSLKIAAVNLIAAIWLWGYSNQLKRMPFIGNLSVAILSGLAIAVIGVHYQTNACRAYFYAVFAFFISLIREIVKDIEDLKGDATFGCQTLPVVWGIRRTKSFIYVLILIFVVTLIYLGSLLANITLNTYFSALLIPTVFITYKLVIADTKRHFRKLSSYLKWFMLLGILSMLLI